MKIRNIIFRGMKGCSNHNCVINPHKSVGTNGHCNCLIDMNRSQLSIVQEHINQIGDREIEVHTKEETEEYPLYAMMQVETSRGFKNEYFVDIAHDEDDVKSIELESNFVGWLNKKQS